MKKKYFWFVIFLTFCVVSLAGYNGEGTINEPYLIKNIEDLIYLSGHTGVWDSGKYFLQTADIDCYQVDLSGNRIEFSSIGTYANPFTGSYDGQGYKISNLYINRGSSENYYGFFRVTSGATLKNIILENVDITGHSYLGALVGKAYDSEIMNCYSSGTITSLGDGLCCGGIVGFSKITSQSEKTTISNCYSSATLSGDTIIGGITNSYSLYVEIKNCAFTGTINGNGKIGGIVGNMFNASPNIIKNCYVAATINSTDLTTTGMIVGNNLTENIVSCFYQPDGLISGVGSASDVTYLDTTNIEELTELEMQQTNKYISAGWDFNTTWFLDDVTINNGYPYLYWQQNTPFAMFVIDQDNVQNIVSDELYAEIMFTNSISQGTQIIIKKNYVNGTSIDGFPDSFVSFTDEFWRIKTNLNQPFVYDLTLDLTDLPTSFVASDVKILKRDDEDSEWVDVTVSRADLSWDEKKVTISGLTSFSDFIPVIDESTLPVELSSFTANLISDNAVSINWEVESESNLIGYYLLKNSANDIAGAELIPSLIVSTNSAQQASYNFIHNPDGNANSIYYWLKSIELNNNYEIYGPVSVTLVNESDNHPNIISGNRLYANYPNPFNPVTNISFSVESPSLVNIKIYNIKGQVVRNLYEENIAKTNCKHSLVWNGKDDAGQRVSSGIYFVKMKVGESHFTQKVIMQK